MDKILTALALTANSILLILMLLVLATAKDRKVTTRYYIAGICFMLLNMLAIIYGGHI